MLAGSCFCGRIKIKYTVGSINAVTGTPKEITKIAESNNTVANYFCPDCGTPLYGGSLSPDGKLDAIMLRAGIFEDQEIIHNQLPVIGIYTSRRLRWIEPLPHCQQLEAMLPPGVSFSLTDPVEPDPLQQHEGTIVDSPKILVFKVPAMLHAFAKDCTSENSTFASVDLLAAGEVEPITKSPSVQTLRVEILGSVMPGDLDATESNGGVDGPTMHPIIQSWREAFRSLPDHHPIEHMQFDLSCKAPYEPRHIVRFLQEVSTVIYMKAKRNVR
ncbi:hypothetical protein E4T47_08048 [Aureobasidium subglaciale]|nr:hypothetical protein E4T47_08048 [Aureobasidium subglaciale]